MKRGDLIRYLLAKGCILLREGSKHYIYYNPISGKQTAVGRHLELDNKLYKKICKELEVPFLS